MANSDNLLNISDSWKSIDSMQINIGDVWKNVSEAYINVGDNWCQFWTAASLYPVVAGYNTSTEASNTTSHTVDLPASIANGDLIIVFIATDGDNTCTFPNEGTDWFQIFELSDTKDIHLSCAYRIADGNEGATITVGTSSSETSAHISFKITGHDAGTNPPEASSGATGADSNPNPDSLTATWGADYNLWIAMEGNDDDDSVTAYPTNYADNQHTLDAGSAGPTISVCTYEYPTTDTQDPGTFTIAATEQWIAGTVVVR